MAGERSREAMIERVPRPFREILAELREMRAVLEEIKQRLTVPVPPAPPVVPVVRPPIPIPPAPPEWRPVTDRLEQLAEELRVSREQLRGIKERLMPLLMRANAYRVETLDLGTARTKAELALEGFALTVFKNEGTIKLRFNARSEDEITIEPLTFPEMVVFDWLDFTKVYITNTQQADKKAVLIAFRRK